MVAIRLRMISSKVIPKTMATSLQTDTTREGTLYQRYLLTLRPVQIVGQGAEVAGRTRFADCVVQCTSMASYSKLLRVD